MRNAPGRPYNMTYDILSVDYVLEVTNGPMITFEWTVAFMFLINPTVAGVFHHPPLGGGGGGGGGGTR